MGEGGLSYTPSSLLSWCIVGVRLLGESQKEGLKRGVVQSGEGDLPWLPAEVVGLWTPAERPCVCVGVWEVLTNSCRLLASMMSSGDRLL